jgi:hypothetical protein
VEMSKQLTDEARLVLAFIRDHPGLTIEELNGFLDKDRVSNALKQLLRHRVVVRYPIGRLNVTGKYYSA